MKAVAGGGTAGRGDAGGVDVLDVASSNPPKTSCDVRARALLPLLTWSDDLADFDLGFLGCEGDD